MRSVKSELYPSVLSNSTRQRLYIAVAH